MAGSDSHREKYIGRRHRGLGDVPPSSAGAAISGVATRYVACSRTGPRLIPNSVNTAAPVAKTTSNARPTV